MKKMSIVAVVAALVLVVAGAAAFAAGSSSASSSDQSSSMSSGGSRGSDSSSTPSSSGSAAGSSSSMQDSSATRGADSSSSMQDSSASRGAQAGGTAAAIGTPSRAKNLVDKKVKNPQGEDLGKIEDIVIDSASGRIAYVVIESDDKLFAVPWQSFAPSATGTELVLNISKDKLKSAPGFSKNSWPDMANPQWGTEVHRYYGQQPYWQSHSGRSMQQKSGQ